MRNGWNGLGYSLILNDKEISFSALRWNTENLCPSLWLRCSENTVRKRKDWMGWLTLGGSVGCPGVRLHRCPGSYSRLISVTVTQSHWHWCATCPRATVLGMYMKKCSVKGTRKVLHTYKHINTVLCMNTHDLNTPFISLFYTHTLAS